LPILALLALALAASSFAALAANGSVEPQAARAIESAKAARVRAGQGDFAGATKLARQALDLALVGYGEGSLVVAIIEGDLSSDLARAGLLKEAEPHSMRAIAVLEALGASKELVVAENNYAGLLADLGRQHEAESHYRKALATLARQGAGTSPEVIRVSRNIGLLYLELGHFAEAERLLAEAMHSTEKIYGVAAPETASAEIDLAKALLARGDNQQAERIVRTSIATLERRHPPDLVTIATARLTLAEIRYRSGDLAGAEAMLKAITDGRPDRNDAPAGLIVPNALYKLGGIYVLRGQYAEAEPVYRQALDLYLQRLGGEHPAAARCLHALAVIYQMLGQHEEAQRFYARAIDIFTHSLGPAHPQIARTRVERSRLYLEAGDAGAAAREAEVAVSALQSLGEDEDYDRGLALAALGFAEAKTNPDDAERAFERGLALIAKTRGESSSDLPPGLTELGRLYAAQNRLEDADRVLMRAVVIRERDQAVAPRTLAETIAEIADIRARSGKDEDALVLYRRATAILETQSWTSEQTMARWAGRGTAPSRWVAERHVAYAETRRQEIGEDPVVKETFLAGQIARLSVIDAAIGRMAARFALADDTLGERIRARQDAIERWRVADESLAELLAKPEEARSPELESRLKATRASAEEIIREVDATLARKFPEYAALTRPHPIHLEEAQTLLRPHEALLVQLTGADKTYLWLIGTEKARLTATSLGRGELRRLATAIRQSVDFSRGSTDDPPPFAAAEAYSLYRLLLGPFEQDLRGVTHLIFVPDGDMSGVPPSLLLTDEPAASLGAQPWLARRLAVSILPSADSLAALRTVARPSRAPQAFVGIGAPELNGAGTQVANARGVGDVLFGARDKADPNLIRTLFAPLPDARGELESLAVALKASAANLYLGATATETLVKHLPLDQFRIIAFATHGIAAGEFPGNAEPALVLTPPSMASDEDDGLLTASEIARLRLDADFVILSACNTASADGTPGAEGLSGLAKAFFYAGSRALLVSNWEVSSGAARLLTTGTIEELTRHPEMGRAEALRRAMLRLVTAPPAPALAHPAHWAPFVLVGEGGPTTVGAAP
jgi:CHAT domain-containing protein/TolA-binding protein